MLITIQMLETIKQILSTHFEISSFGIDTNTAIVKDLGANLVDLIELVAAFDSAFEIKIGADEFSRCNTVGDVLGLVKSKVFKLG